MSVQQPNTTHKHATHSTPIMQVLLGIALMVFWAIATILQIQTSEAFITQGNAVSLSPNWNIIMQPVEFMQGHLSTTMAKAVMWGWGCELIFLMFFVGYEVAHNAVSSSGKKLASWFQTGCIVIVAFDGYSDFQYGSLASGLWGQLAFALITSFSVLFLGLIGLHLIERGFVEWSR